MFETSPDGRSWTTRSMLEAPGDLRTAKLDIGACYDAPGGPATQARFDDLNLR
ncbi:MAG: hypothetical protein M3619_32065 [Myxococcota bacterium]|nr:hypothetical protein [Myxococcota bacterium]